MSKHTLGPWAVVLRHEPMEIAQKTKLHTKDGLIIAEIRWNPSCYRGDIMDANARLIAAAPELLEACKDLMAGFSVKTQADEVLMKETQWIIAKAEGANHE